MECDEAGLWLFQRASVLIVLCLTYTKFVYKQMHTQIVRRKEMQLPLSLFNKACSTFLLMYDVAW